ncbi:unnamed protein product [Cylindrotheca closterium]|uniref:Uncharacterized protein n=1 Tax=Cylindrotheca closterium TaxID=2856 RepID=A0AAD2CDH3_9STRA|nr:unnamed protein product [Cylindrotheca closterium]
MVASIDSAKVRELENELNGIRSAFKQYINNTRETETGLDQELGNMNNKLVNTANANVDLANRLETMAPLISSLENSLGESKKQLLEESRLRREMEAKLKAVDGKHFAFRQEFDSLREENSTLREELDGNRSQWEEFRSIVGSNREIRTSRLGDRSVVTDDARRSDCDTISAANLTKGSSIPLDDTYLEVLDELETVTEQLISTQQKLWITEDKLGIATARIEDMEDQEQRHLNTEKKLLAAEARLRELEGNQGRLRLAEARMLQLENQMVSDETLHDRVLELEKELVAANNHIQYSNELNGTRIEECKTNARAVNHELKVKIEENEMLLEQVSHLQQHIAGEAARFEATKMMEPPGSQDQDHEVEAMRSKIDKLSQENSALKEIIIQLEKGPGTPSMPNGGGFAELKDEIENLHFELTATKDKHRLTLLENDAAWRRKLEKARGGTRSEMQAKQMTSEGKDKIVEGLQEQIKILCKERDLLEGKAIDLENENFEKDHHIQDIEGRLLDLQKEKSRLEQSIRSLKSTGQASSAIIEELKAEQGVLEAGLKAMEPLVNDCGENDTDTVSELDLIERVRKLCRSLKNSNQKPQDVDMKQIEELREELDRVTEELAASKASQKRLKRALNLRGDQEDEIDGIRSQFRLTKSGQLQQRNPYARDPEPHDEAPPGGCLRWMPNTNSLNIHSPSHCRSDPPTRDSQPHGDSSDLRWLLQRLEAVDRENRILRSSGGDEKSVKFLDGGTSLTSSRDAELRKESIRRMENYLENEKSGITRDDVESDILLKLTAERKDLQDQIVELKQALSTSELSKNESGEELKASQGEISRLRNSILSLKEAISKLRNEYNNILEEAEEREQQNRSEIAGFATQFNELVESNEELEESNNAKVKQIQTLTQEIALAQDSIHTANEKYEDAATELESAKKMVDEVRETAEQKGREVATAELRAEMREEREKERLEIKAQLEEAHRENIRLRKVMKAHGEKSFKSLQTFKMKLEDAVAKSERWQQASEKAHMEMNRMMEEEKRLKMDLEALTNELLATRDELDFANSSLTRRRTDRVKLKRSKSLGLLSTGTDEYKLYKDLHQKIQQVIAKVADVDSDSMMHSRRTEGLHLKAQLTDIDMSINKIFRENIMLEEELDYLNSTIDETREAAAKKGRREATREAWSEIRERQENDIRDFKDQFSSLVEENRYLETQLRKYETERADSDDSTSVMELGNADLWKEVELSNLEAKKLSQDCLRLRLAMESMKDEHEQVLDELKMQMRGESEGIILRLKSEVRELRSEISEMQQITDEPRRKEKEYDREIKRLVHVLSNSQKTLDKVNEERNKMAEAMKVTKSSSAQVIEKLRFKLLSSSQEIAELSSKVSDLTLTIDEQKKDLLHSQQQENQNDQEGERQEVHNNHINSSSLHEYTNELEATLKLSRDEVVRSKDELLRLKKRLKCLQKEAKEHLTALNIVKTELAKERLNRDQTIKVLEAINSRLNSVEGMTPGHELGRTTETTQMAERLEWRVEKLISIMNDAKLEKQDRMKLQVHVETSEMKFTQAKKEASRLEQEVSRLITELNTTKNKHSKANTKDDFLALDKRPRPEVATAKNKHHQQLYKDTSTTKLPLMNQALNRRPKLRTDPEPRDSMDSDIISEVASMKSTESTDYMAGLSSELIRTTAASSGEPASPQKRYETVDIRSEADCAIIDVERFQVEKRHDPPSQSDLRMDNAIYHV